MSTLRPRAVFAMILALLVLTPLLQAPGTSQAAGPSPAAAAAMFAPDESEPVGGMAVAPRSTGFVDVATGNVHAEAITALVEAGVTQGCSPDGTRFCPADAVTREQMATFLDRTLAVLDRALPAAPPGAFSDTDGSVHAAAIDRLAAAGIAQGTAPGRFSPRESVSRGQMALFLERAFELATGTHPGFSDVGDVHDAAVRAVASAGITLGCSPGRFCPGDPVRRDQMASFLERSVAQEIGIEEPPALPEPDHEADPDGDPEPPPGEEEPLPQPPDLPPDLPEGPPDTWDPDELPDDGLPDPFDPDADDLSDNPAEDPSGFDPGTLPEIEGVEGMPDDPTVIGEPEDRPAPPPPPDDDPEVFPLLVPPDQAVVQPRLGASNQTGFGPRGAGWLPYRNLPIQVGALHTFDRDGQRMFSCSGTVVARDLVLTAAHCLHYQGRVARSYRFWPDLYGNQARYGAWEGYDGAFVPRYWVDHEPRQTAFLYDFALIRLRPNAQGRHIGDVVGSLPILLDASSVTLPKYSIGYPVEGWFAATNRPFGAAFPYYCYDDDRGRFQHGGGWTSLAWGCYFSGGKSGGPVLAWWNGRWHVSSVVSSGGRIEDCQTWGIAAGSCASTRGVWFLRNAYGPDLSSSAHQFGGFLRSVTGS